MAEGKGDEETQNGTWSTCTSSAKASHVVTPGTGKGTRVGRINQNGICHGKR